MKNTKKGTLLLDIQEGEDPTPEVEIFEKEDKIRLGVGVKVLEADKASNVKKLEVKLIQQGWSKNGFYYSKEVAESVADLIKQRRKMYMDHDMWSGPSRSWKDVTAMVTDAYAQDGASYAIVEMVGNPNTEWLYDIAKRYEGEVGASIDARVKVREANPEKDPGITSENAMRRKYVVEEIVFLNSTDFVTYASAGGEVTDILASMNEQNTKKYTPEKIVASLEELTQKVEKLNQTENKENQNMDLTKAKLLSEHKDLVESLRSDFKAELAKDTEFMNSVKESVRKELEQEYVEQTESEKKINDLKDQVKTLESENKTLEEERDTLKVKVDEYQTKEAMAAKRDTIDKLIKEAELPEEAISDIFKQDLMKLKEEEDIKSRIKDRKALIGAQEAQIKGNGRRKEGDTKDHQESETVVVNDDDLVSSIKSEA